MDWAQSDLDEIGSVFSNVVVLLVRPVFFDLRNILCDLNRRSFNILLDEGLKFVDAAERLLPRF